MKNVAINGPRVSGQDELGTAAQAYSRADSQRLEELIGEVSGVPGRIQEFDVAQLLDTLKEVRRGEAERRHRLWMSEVAERRRSRSRD